MRKLKYLLAATLALSSTANLRAEEWPKWRGPSGDGISRETGLLTEWPAEGPKKMWTIPVGVGHASPVAVDGKLYLFTRDEDKNLEVLEAYDAASAKKLWGQSYEGGYSREGVDPTWRGTRATPTIVGDQIYTYGGGGDLVARNLSDGKEIWHDNILKQTSASPLEWGEASSPLVVGDVIYVQGGIGKGAPVALAVNRSDGKFLWKSQAVGDATGKNNMKGGTGGGYAAPILITVAGKPQLIVLGGIAVYGMDPATGKTLWQEEWLTSYDVNSTTPIYVEPNLFISTGYGHGCMMLEVTAAGAKKLWESKAMSSKFPGVVLDRGYLYGNSEGIPKCLSWPDGKVVWELKDDPADRLGPGGSLVRFGDYLITITERGRLTLASATPEGYKKISTVKEVTKGANIWATPLIYRGKLYVKGVAELICLDISGK